MTDEELLAHLAGRLPQLAPTQPPERLEGGLLNQTWRITGRSGSWVVKHAPPFIATVPEIALDPARLAFEARALADLSADGRLSSVASEAARAPLLVDFDPDAGVLVMEDVGRVEHLGLHLAARQDMDEHARRLGHFVGRLHAGSLGDPELACEYRNLEIQRTRHRLQYQSVGALLAAAGVPDAGGLGERAADLGERLQRPGRCLVMGDLWPPSLLVTHSGLRVIDWEFAHFGSPAQDLGHLAAHLWMLHDRAAGSAVARRVVTFWRTFLSGYLETAEAKVGRLLDAEVRRDLELHLGAEILMRTVGPFHSASLYADEPPSGAAVTTAVRAAAGHLRGAGGTALTDLV